MFFLQIFMSVREREGSEPWTSLYKLVKITCFSIENIIYLFYKTSYLNE